MKTVGIICEYNPFHLGHLHQIQEIRRIFGEETCIVCAMSGNFVQRGTPAIFDKSIRAEAAVKSGADLVLEMPITGCLSSAEGFAECGIEILNGLCDVVSFGSESMDHKTLMAIAEIIADPNFDEHLVKHLESGVSYPSAREAALADFEWNGSYPQMPNDILALEYCRAMLRYHSNLEVCILHRENNYHSETAGEYPSATAIRKKLLSGAEYSQFIPAAAQELFSNASVHDRTYGEKAILYRLRSMKDEEYEQLPYGAEGLWRRFMHACRHCDSVDSILNAVKTKRYTYSRLSRMLMCAYLGITGDQMSAKFPYVRVLAFSDRGRLLLHAGNTIPFLVNVGTDTDSEYQELEYRCQDLYQLFSCRPEEAGTERKRRVYYWHEKEL